MVSVLFSYQHKDACLSLQAGHELLEPAVQIVAHLKRDAHEIRKTVLFGHLKKQAHEIIKTVLF
jgi:hypothetical protein